MPGLGFGPLFHDLVGPGRHILELGADAHQEAVTAFGLRTQLFLRYARDGSVHRLVPRLGRNGRACQQ